MPGLIFILDPVGGRSSSVSLPPSGDFCVRAFGYLIRAFVLNYELCCGCPHASNSDGWVYGGLPTLRELYCDNIT